MKFKFPVWASIFAVLGILILCSLGVWQLYRLQWKTELLQNIDNAFSQLESGSVKSFKLPDDMVRDDLIVGGRLRGRYFHDKEVFIQSRVYDGVPGYHVITPFWVSEDGFEGFVLVNRGWIPLELERPEDFALYRPVGEMNIVGILIESSDSGYHPENDVDKNMWYNVDIQEMEDALDIMPLQPKIFYASSDRDAVGDYPVSVMNGLRANIRNNHLQYAFFWFTMACALVGVYIFRFRHC